MKQTINKYINKMVIGTYQNLNLIFKENKMIKIAKDKNKNLGIKKIMKKNQVVLLALALMLMTAGYMNYTNNHENENMLLASLGDAKLVSANVINDANILNEVNNSVVESNNEENIVEQNNINEENQIEENTTNETVETNANNVDSNAPVSKGTNVENQTTEEAESTSNEENDEVQETSTKQADNDYFTRSKLERETMYSQMLETYTKILENGNISSEQKDIAENEIKNINNTKNAIMIAENLLATKGFENVVIFVNSPSVNVVVKKENLETEEVAQIQNIVQRELNTDIENIHITTN